MLTNGMISVMLSDDMRYMECTGTPHDLGIFKWDYVTNIQNGIPNKELEPNYITIKKAIISSRLSL